MCHAFSIYTDFQCWKVVLEKQTNSWFAQDSGGKSLMECRKTYVGISAIKQ